uniref:Uncharacterized protein n=1 Tax=Lactuca sativa TaxID=4236 RepID=A0A9R1WCZ5_LACSA|nr:hypothetical protein LSAT_V11C200074900 [Lactuca sativa]
MMVAGSNNDINFLDQLPIFDNLLNGKALDAPFTVNGNEYKYGYYLTDGNKHRQLQHLVEEREKKSREDKKEHVRMWNMLMEC